MEKRTEHSEPRGPGEIRNVAGQGVYDQGPLGQNRVGGMQGLWLWSTPEPARHRPHKPVQEDLERVRAAERVLGPGPDPAPRDPQSRGCNLSTKPE